MDFKTDLAVEALINDHLESEGPSLPRLTANPLAHLHRFHYSELSERPFGRHWYNIRQFVSTERRVNLTVQACVLALKKESGKRLLKKSGHRVY